MLMTMHHTEKAGFYRFSEQCLKTVTKTKKYACMQKQKVL